MPSARPVDISALSEAQMNAELEKGYADMQAPENASGQLDRFEECIMDLDHMPKRYHYVGYIEIMATRMDDKRTAWV